MTLIRFYPAAILAFAVGVVSAHSDMQGPAADFDVEEDGELSIEEYTAYLQASEQDMSSAAAKFARLDRDKNGFLSSAEFMLGLPKAPRRDQEPMTPL